MCGEKLSRLGGKRRATRGALAPIASTARTSSSSFNMNRFLRREMMPDSNCLVSFPPVSPSIWTIGRVLIIRFPRDVHFIQWAFDMVCSKSPTPTQSQNALGTSKSVERRRAPRRRGSCSAPACARDRVCEHFGTSLASEKTLSNTLCLFPIYVREKNAQVLSLLFFFF